MKAVAGSEFTDWIGESGVVGLWEVVKRYRYFRRQFCDVLAQIANTNPRAVVLIDYPGFNLRLARALRAKFPALKIIYYISPQVWAWNRGRIKQMGRVLDLMLCIFPFEEELYNASGLRTVFVGHPLTGASPHSADESRDRSLVAILPGSRQREVRKILPVMLGAARVLMREHDNLRVEIAAASDELALMINAEIARRGMGDHVRVKTRNAEQLLRAAGVGMITSGTATLEAAVARLPFVLVYRVSWLTYVAARLVVKVKFLGMPNVLAGREIVPEFIQHRARADTIARAVARLLDGNHVRQQQLAAFDEVAAALGSGDASVNAAREIMRELS